MEIKAKTNDMEEFRTYFMPYEDQGKVIYGELLLPSEEKEKYPLVIISHGLYATHKKIMPYAMEMLKLGYACYIYDFCGGAPENNSSGNMLDMSVLTEVADLKCVFHMLEQCKVIDKGNIHLLGVSQGGMVSALFAAEESDRVSSLILFYPALCIPDDVQKRFEKKENIPDKYIHFDETLGGIYARDVYDLDIWKEIVKYKGPVLLEHGTADPLVSVLYSEKAAEKYANAQLEKIEGAAHGFYEGTAKDQAFACVKKFLNK